MNTTLFRIPMIFLNNSMMTTVEFWFIPFDILSLICSIIVIGFAIFFLVIIIIDKRCHTVPMMLIANSCLSEFIIGSDLFSMTVFTLYNDLKQIKNEDLFCAFRGYLGFTSCALQNYSYFLQAIYRYIIIVYPTRLFWQSFRIQILFIGLIWIFTILCPIPFLFTNEIIYNVDNQICQLPLQLSFGIVFLTLFIYIIPVLLVMFIHIKLVRYVHKMSKCITPVNTLFHAQRELKMVRRIFILVISITIIGFPYAIFIFISFFTIPPKYHFRIAYIFVNISIVFVMICLFQFTDQLKISIKKRIKRRFHVEVARVA